MSRTVVQASLLSDHLQYDLSRRRYTPCPNGQCATRGAICLAPYSRGNLPHSVNQSKLMAFFS